MPMGRFLLGSSLVPYLPCDLHFNSRLLASHEATCLWWRWGGGGRCEIVPTIVKGKEGLWEDEDEPVMQVRQWNADATYRFIFSKFPVELSGRWSRFCWKLWGASLWCHCDPPLHYSTPPTTTRAQEMSDFTAVLNQRRIQYPAIFPWRGLTTPFSLPLKVLKSESSQKPI